MSRFLLQMAGESGAGKSTLALAIGKATGAVVLDKDLIKGPLIEDGLEDGRAGSLCHDVFFLLAQSLLVQGFSVVLDSAAFWQQVVDRGRALAAEACAGYLIIECRCEDEFEQERRLSTRKRQASQPASMTELALALARPGVLRRPQAPHLSIDTTQPIEACLNQALEYIGHGAG